MRGRIEVESEPGRGARFRVVLPSGRGASRASVPPPPIALDGPRGRLLVVDDEPAVGVALRRLLGTDHDVEVVLNGRDALARLDGGSEYDVIFCDLMMPGMTGMDLFAELCRKSSELASKVVFITGGAFTRRAREFLQSVTNLSVEKPFDHAALRKIVADRVLRAGRWG